MFDVYIVASSGNVIDFDRASFLMDRDLLRQACEAVRHMIFTTASDQGSYDEPQEVWDEYCERHYEKYGEPFVCDADLNWDRDQPRILPPPAPDGIRVLGSYPLTNSHPLVKTLRRHKLIRRLLREAVRRAKR